MLVVRIKKSFEDFSMSMNFSLDQSGITVLFGRSGAGKTTLVNMIAGLVLPDEGFISCGRGVFFDSEKNFCLPPNRRGLGYVFQQSRLFSHLSVKNNLLFGPKFCGRPFDPDFFARAVDVLGIGHLLSRMPNYLSGGESQRVSIGRALLASVSFLLMDEPLSSLDDERKEDLIGYIASIPKNFDIPIMYVTHSTEEVASLADRVVYIQDGCVASVESHRKGCGV
jgi:molybdate transport system ATP-binding protein